MKTGNNEIMEIGNSGNRKMEIMEIMEIGKNENRYLI